MRTDDFEYDLPEKFIAQRPARPRDSSRLLVLHRESGKVTHRRFYDLPDLLQSGDALVLNQTRVLPARLQARKLETGGRAEILLLRKVGPRDWIAMVGGKAMKAGRRLELKGGIKATIEEELDGPQRRIRFDRSLEGVLPEIGEMPLPPYITEPLRDPEEYQTVFSKGLGSAAAPTAGLHFTPSLLEKLVDKGIEVIFLTLHVGMDTFAPVRAEDPRDHVIHSEWCELPAEAATRLQSVKDGGARIVAVGTTTIRTLETAVREKREGNIEATSGPTDLFILPGFEFQAVDALITNFHLPRSTLLMLVSAFAGRQRILQTYEIAKQEGYRFYSFGDAMLVL